MSRRVVPHLVVCALLALTAGILMLTPDPRVDESLGIRVELPDRIGPYEGDGIRFCKDSQCSRRSLRLSQLTDDAACPKCGGELAEWSPAERYWFPPDTEIVRKEYRSAAGQTFFVSIVVSGKERRSIHRPEVCLSSQGNVFPAKHTLNVPLDDRSPLTVSVLDLARKSTGESTGCYAYWFVTEGRETHKHLERLAWMAWDNLAYNTKRRWAYISVSTRRAPEGTAHLDRVGYFIAMLHPRLEE